MTRRVALLAILVVPIGLSRGDGPADNNVESVRRIPKLGLEVSPQIHEDLQKRLGDMKEHAKRIDTSRLKTYRNLIPDILVFHKAVSDALKYQEFFTEAEVGKARELLDEANRRIDDVVAGDPRWRTRSGPVARGYVSRIDGSIQPYGVFVPPSYTAAGAAKYRLDVWFHGRGETLSEVNFLHDRTKNRGEFTPTDTIVLHPYGRYCNANKFAGEVDVLEAIEAVKSNYRIDDERISVRGFSMGGAACWQFAVHYSDRWFAANPGAGFAETAKFLRVFQKEDVKPPWYEQKLWHLYDCTDYAVNLLQCPTVAYSGEIDNQKQAADVMAEALSKEGITLTHIIGPKTPHRYHPAAHIEVDRRLESLAVEGRKRYPSTVQFVTYTLKYNQMSWVTIDSLIQHWKKARVRAAYDPKSINGLNVGINTENVSALTLAFPPGFAPFSTNASVLIGIDSQKIEVPGPGSDRSWSASLDRVNGSWKLRAEPAPALRKRHDLQGPIDDAFMDSFVIVKPTQKSARVRFQEWVDAELPRSIEHWRRHFRGEARVKDDSAIGDDDIRDANLILWGDPESNAILKRIAAKLPIVWDAKAIQVGTKSFDSENHALIAIYPNPLNPERYVVLNSGFTFREYDYLNNARQIPKLPDWAVIDLRTPPNSRYPGKVVDANFFGELWELRQ
jgi:hypothetical protein